MFRSRRKPEMVPKGFTLLEIMVAMAILVTGLLAMALLMARMYRQTVRSRYMSMAASLASEKLEDLSRYKQGDPAVCSAGGSLTADSGPVSVTCNSLTSSVNYYDTVTVSLSNGAMSETYASLNGAAIQYVTQQFTADGIYHAPTNSATAPLGTTFNRRWTIEKDIPVAGVRLVTVLVTLVDLSIQPPVTFQMSMVRP